jgi:hypothetical protein
MQTHAEKAVHNREAFHPGQPVQRQRAGASVPGTSHAGEGVFSRHQAGADSSPRTSQLKAVQAMAGQSGLAKKIAQLQARADQSHAKGIKPKAVQRRLANSSADRSVATASFAGTGQPIQLQTRVFTRKDQTYNYGTGKINVGEVMEVGLDPQDMKQGQSANLNTSQDDMMAEIRNQWGIVGGGVVKGHLWNDNLGGSAMNYNLYPITKAANSDHLGYVENKAKELIWIHKRPIYYKVEVDGVPNISQAKAEFDCEIRDWNPQTNTVGGLLFGPVSIPSDLNDVGAYNEAYETYTGNTADRQKRLRAPKWAVKPKTKVGELTKAEAQARQSQ